MMENSFLLPGKITKQRIAKRNFKTVDKTQICDNLDKSINQVMLNLEPIFQENFDNHFTIFIQTLIKTIDIYAPPKKKSRKL